MDEVEHINILDEMFHDEAPVSPASSNVDHSPDETSNDESEVEVDQINLMNRQTSRLLPRGRIGKGRISVEQDEELNDMELCLDRLEELEETHHSNKEKLLKAVDHNEGDIDDVEEDELMQIQRAMYDEEDEEEDEEEESEEQSQARFNDFFLPDRELKRRVRRREMESKSRSGVKKGTSEETDKAGESEEASEGDALEEEEEFDDEEKELLDEVELEIEEDMDQEEEEGGDYDYLEENEEGNEKPPSALQTPHQVRQARLSSAIGEMEKDLVGPRSWDLRGEVRAGDRPENSLLSLAATVERASKPAPLITQEHTSSLEELVLKRVREGRFDNVTLRKTQKPISTDLPSLSQEKSSKGLGDIYAEEFLRQSVGQDQNQAEGLPEAEECKALFAKICSQLDALTHFHYAPRPVSTEPILRPLAPALTLEDAQPETNIPSSSTLAPREASGRDVSLLSSEEMTRSQKQRIHRDAVAKKKRTDSPQDDSATKDILKQKKGSPTVISSNHEMDTKQFSNSSKFFSNLQEQAQSIIKKKAPDSLRSSNTKKPESSGLSFKL